MFIEIVSVEREDRPSSNGKGTYGMLTVAYKSNGKIAEKKIMSFTNPAVFKGLEGLQKGDTIDVTSVKNEKTGYWDWTALNEGGGTPVANTQPATATRVSGSNYETKEERAVKQRYIVRQSSISNAIDSLSIGAKSALSAKDVIALAKEYEEYVFSEKEGVDAIIDLDNDIPY
jgi:hypothetical protein